MLNRERSGPEIFIQISFEQQRSFPVEHMATPFVFPWKQGAFHQAGFIFKGEELHGLALFGSDDLAGDQPTKKAYRATLPDGMIGEPEQFVCGQCPCRAPLRIKKNDGMPLAQKAQYLVFIS